MSAFKLNSLPGVNGVRLLPLVGLALLISGFPKISEKFPTTLPGVGIPDVLGQGSATSTGLLSGLGQAAPKSSSTISDKLLKLFFRIISFFFSMLRKLIPSSIQNFLVWTNYHYSHFMSSNLYQVFIIPPLLMFYETALRVYFPRLPSLVKVAFKLYQRGILSTGTVVWLASSLPGNFLGGLGAIGGAAMQTTAALAGGAAAVGNALVGTTTGIVGGAATVTTDIAHVLSGVPNVAGQATSLATAGLNEATSLAAGATHAVAGGLSIVKDGQTAVAENLAHLVSGENAIAPVNLVPDVIGATQAAATESVAKVANVLGSINPLHLNVGPKESQATHVRLPLVASTVTPLMRLKCWATTAEFVPAEVARILIGRFLDCYRSNMSMRKGCSGGGILHFGSSRRLSLHSRIWRMIRNMPFFRITFFH